MIRKPLDVGDLISPETSPSVLIQSQPLGDSQVDLWSPNIDLEREPDPFAISEQPKPELLVELTQGSAEELEPVVPTEEPTAMIIETQNLSQSTTTKTDNFTASILSSVSQHPSSRLYPIPPQISPVHFQLPTRRWTETTVFLDIPFVDLLSDTLSKAFASLSVSQRPSRPMMILEQALEYPDPFIPLIKSRRYFFLIKLEGCSTIGT
jgi:hypothetical protein